MMSAAAVLNCKKRTHSEVSDNEEAMEYHSLLLGKAITIVAEQNGDWLNEADLVALETTCTQGRRDWCIRAWKPLAFKTWPHLILDGEAKRPTASESSSSESNYYKQLFCSPRHWLETSAAQIKLLPKWGSDPVHYNKECGRCGCNCRGECPGVAIENEYRWEKKDQLEWPVNRESVPRGEGYEMSYNTMIQVNVFCDSCFERLQELDIVQRKDYTRVRGNTLFGLVTREIIKPKRRYTPFFSSKGQFSWQRLYDVKPDDVAIVIANALIQENCQTKELQLGGIHCGFGPLGYKALAYALSINKSVLSIDFYKDHYDDEASCVCCYNEEAKFSYGADMSKGLFLKAFRHNTDSKLYSLRKLCSSAFGPHTWEAWKTAKPYLNCGPYLGPGYSGTERYHDIQEYVSSDNEDDVSSDDDDDDASCDDDADCDEM